MKIYTKFSTQKIIKYTGKEGGNNGKDILFFSKKKKCHWTKQAGKRQGFYPNFGFQSVSGTMSWTM